MVVYHTDGLHKSINNGSPYEFKPLFFKSLDILSDSGVETGTSDRFLNSFLIG